MDRDALMTVNARTVVCYHCENGIGPERFLSGSLEKDPERVIGIFHRVIAPLFVGVFGNPALRIGVGSMVGNRKDRCQERLAGIVKRSQLINRAIHQVFVAHAPGRREGWMRKMLLLDEPLITIADSIGSHAVEYAPPAVKKDRRITVPPEHPRNGLDIVGFVAFDDG